MKLLRSALQFWRRGSRTTARSLNPQQNPIPLKLGEPNQNDGHLKVDLCIRAGSKFLVAGWRTSPVKLEVAVDGRRLPTKEVVFDRADVNAHLGMSWNQPCGFALEADSPDSISPSSQTVLHWTTPDGRMQSSSPLQFRSLTDLSEDEINILGPLAPAAIDLKRANQFNQEIPAVNFPVPRISFARGVLEAAAVCDATGDMVVLGWVVQLPGVRVWLEDDSRRTYSLEGAFRRFRPDVQKAVQHEFGDSYRDSGFILRITAGPAGTAIRLKASGGGKPVTLAQINSAPLSPDPVSASRWLFSAETSLTRLHERFPLIDEPILDELSARRAAGWGQLPIEHRNLGHLPEQPVVSVIIPLFGRSDFVEHQLIEFAKDPWLLENAEIIYVLDDPELVEGFKAEAAALHQLYGVPFRWIWGQVNRGFSGANNLGAQFACGRYLVFLNSDAFPQSPGWIESLTDTLEKHPELGAVGPRLVYGDGGIQHAGIRFQRREELGIWINHHPHMGLDPVLDPHRQLSEVAAVTGACIALRRDDFAAIGGWDTGYLIGDFEDSDLCFKLRAQGKCIGYLPTVQLTHLERQSFNLLGQADFRQRVVIYNAVRHQRRWANLLPSAAAMAHHA